MALAVDASTPAFAAAATDPWTTASFTPPNDSLLVVVVTANGSGSAAPVLTVTSTGLTFTSRVTGGTVDPYVEIFTSEVGANGGTARTVSVETNLLGSNFDSGGVKVYVLTGQHATFVDATGSGTSITNNITPTVLTTVSDGSWVFGGGSEWNSLGIPTSTDVNEGYDDADMSFICVRKSATTSPAGAVTLNFDAAGTDAATWAWAAISIAPATGGVTASPTGIASAEVFGTVAAVLSLFVSPAGIASSEAFGTPAASATLTVSPAGIASAEVLGSPTISATLVATPGSIASAEAFGTPVVSVGGTNITASPAGIASAEIFGTPVAVAVLTASPTGIASGEAVGSPTVQAVLTVTPTGVATAEAFGTVTIQSGVLRDVTVVAGVRSNHITGGVGLSGLIAGVRSNHITGGVDVPRDLRTGSIEYITAEVTFVGESAGNIAGATGVMQFTLTDATPAAGDPNWAAADVTARTDVTGGAKLALSRLHTAGAAGIYRVWAKVTDNPEVPILLCGYFTVT